jgi:hypothetical protein
MSGKGQTRPIGDVCATSAKRSGATVPECAAQFSSSPGPDNRERPHPFLTNARAGNRWLDKLRALGKEGH